MPKRLVHWDLLRALAMFFVVLCHTALYLGPIGGIDTNVATVEFALICDPVFFALSGYFAIRPLRGNYKGFLLKKFRDVVVPLIVYVVCLYLFDVAKANAGFDLSSFASWCLGAISGNFWFIPCLIPFLILAPFLNEMFSSLSDRTAKTLEWVVYVAALWGTGASVFAFFAGDSFVSSLISTLLSLLPPAVIPGGYFLYFCLGYFIRREESHVSSRAFKVLACLGVLLWLACPILALAGYQRVDPSYLWLPATVSVFLLFAKIEIRGDRVGKAISFLARHSYAVYLLQFTTIKLVYGRLNAAGLMDGSASLPAFERLCLQAFAVFASYVLAVLIGFVLDGTLVQLAKRGVEALLERCLRSPADS